MRFIDFRFCGFGFKELLPHVGGLGGPGTIEICLNGSHVKMGNRHNQLLFEPIYRIRMHELEVSLFTENDQASSLLVEVQKARQSLTHVLYIDCTQLD